MLKKAKEKRGSNNLALAKAADLYLESIENSSPKIDSKKIKFDNYRKRLLINACYFLMHVFHIQAIFMHEKNVRL